MTSAATTSIMEFWRLGMALLMEMKITFWFAIRGVPHGVMRVILKWHATRPISMVLVEFLGLPRVLFFAMITIKKHNIIYSTRAKLYIVDTIYLYSY